MNMARSAADDPIEILGAIGIIPVVIIDDAAQAAPLAGRARRGRWCALCRVTRL